MMSSQFKSLVTSNFTIGITIFSHLMKRHRFSTIRPTVGNGSSSIKEDNAREFWPSLLLTSKETASRTGTKNLISQAIRLQNSSGDVVPSSLAQSFVSFYKNLSMNQKVNLMTNLSEEFGFKRDALYNLCLKYTEIIPDPISPNPYLRVEKELRSNLKPPFEILFDQILKLPDGLMLMIGLRADLIELYKKSKDKRLQVLQESIRESLHVWFGAGHLELRRVTWENTTASVLEKVYHTNF